MSRPRYRRRSTVGQAEIRMRSITVGTVLGVSMLSTIALSGTPALAEEAAPVSATVEADHQPDVAAPLEPAVTPDAGEAEPAVTGEATTFTKDTGEVPQAVVIESMVPSWPAVEASQDSQVGAVTQTVDDAPRVTLGVNPQPKPSGWVTDYTAWVSALTWPSTGATIETITAEFTGAQNETFEFAGVRDAQFRMKVAGESTLSVTATDSAGLTATQSVVVRYDPTVPLARAHGLPDVVTVGDTWTVDFSCSDVGSGIESCEMLGHEIGDVVTFDTVGRVEFDIRATDKAGNVWSSRAWAEVRSADRTPPTLALSKPPASASGWHDRPIEIGVTAADAGDGVDMIVVTLDGRMLPGVRGEHTSVTVKGEGSHTLSVWATDKAGNTTISETYDIRIDETAPTIELSAYTDDDAPVRDLRADAGSIFTQGDEVLLHRNCVDVGSWIVECNGDVDNETKLATDEIGVHRVRAWAIDAAGNRTDAVFEYTVTGETSGGGTAGGDAAQGTGADGSPRAGSGSSAGALASTGAESLGLIATGATLAALGLIVLFVRRRAIMGGVRR